jgi:hypothetical protein
MHGELNQNKLVLLHAMPGELKHEAELLQRFDKFKMEGLRPLAVRQGQAVPRAGHRRVLR